MTSNIIGVDGMPLQKSFPVSSAANQLSFMFGSTNIGGVEVNAESAMRHGIVYACSRVLEENIGQLPIRLYETKGLDEYELDNHPLLDVLTYMPNDYMTWQEMLEMIVKHLNMAGNFYAWINARTATHKGKKYKKILEIIPIPNPNCVTIEMKNRKLTYNIHSDNFQLPKQVFSSDEILHIKSSTLDGVYGITPISQAARTIGVSMAAEKHGEEFFNNNATPNGYIQMQGSLTPDALERFKANWNQNYQGIKNSSKTAVLEEGTEYKTLAINHKDAQFLETRNFQKNEICSIFRVPPQMVYADANVTYSNVEQAMISFHRDTLVPLIRRIETRINTMLPRNLRVRLDDREIIRGDSKTQADVNDRYFKLGVLSINEVRKNINLPSIENGDVRAVVTNNITLGTLDELSELRKLAKPAVSKPETPHEDGEKEENSEDK